MIIALLIQIIVFFICLAAHEAAHAWASYKLGDATAKVEGRMTLNPLAHIDMYGTVIVPLVLAITGAPVFGWAKPVMIDPRNFKNPTRDYFLSSMAGPLANFVFAVVAALVMRFFPDTSILRTILYLLIQVNITLGVFNLLPIPPLDGSKIWYLILPAESAFTLERFGPVILIAVLIFSSTANNFLLKFVSTISQYLIGLIS